MIFIIVAVAFLQIKDEGSCIISFLIVFVQEVQEGLKSVKGIEAIPLADST